MSGGFIGELRRVHTKALEINWAAHIAGVNQQYRLTGDYALSTADIGIPPAWFNGDVEAIQPNNWVLVVSLNPTKPPPGYYRGQLTSETAWDFWRTHNTQWWYTRFFRPMVRMASTALGEQVPSPGAEERRYATERMVFVELCPYASKKYNLSAGSLVELGQNDPGFLLAQRVRRILLEQARPALVLVNGDDAVNEFAIAEAERLHWDRRDYKSDFSRMKSGQPKPLWHYEGWYRTGQKSIPAGGFKFLRKPANHNSYGEIDQLGKHLHNVSESSS